MFYNSTLLLVAANDNSHIAELYSELVSHSLHDTMKSGSLDIMVMRNQTTLQDVQTVTAAFYNLARQQAHELRREGIRVTVLIDGEDFESGRRQNWEVVAAGKYEVDLLQEFRLNLPEGSKLSSLPSMIFKMPDPLAIAHKNGAVPVSRNQSVLNGIAEEEEEDVIFSEYAGPSHKYVPNMSQNATDSDSQKEKNESENNSDGNGSQQSNEQHDQEEEEEEKEKERREKIRKQYGLRFDSKEDEKLFFDTLGPQDASEWEHDVVAVGGTFDHLHDGHRVLLTVAGYLAKECLIVGITGPELLVRKKYAEVLESYMTRQLHVEEFLKYVFPLLDVETHMIHDVSGPTATVEDIDALVLSKETIHGGIQVNKTRIEKGFKPLIVYDVDVIGCIEGTAKDNYSDKLSSTELRRLEFEKLKLDD